MNQKRPNRYPGVQPFQKEQAHLFFGRDDDTERLYDLILLEKLVVLFGKSGHGKSSLLNAGILPLLEKETANGKRKYVPVRVRFNTWSEQGETLFAKFIFHLISSLQENTHPRQAISLGPDNIPETLWSVLKFSRPTPDTSFVLIFDQFEEFFTYPEQQQQEFKRQLAEVLYADVPTYVKQNEDKHNPEEIAFLSEKMDVKTVFSIRADRMSDLDRMKDKLPAILHKRCELRALNREQAREALVEPAQKIGNFASPSFAWSDAALQRILDAFSRDNAGREVGVEAFLLQVLAQNVESQVIRGAIANHDGLPAVRPEDLPADLSNIFSEYYRNKIGDLPPEQQLPARKLIEDGLIFATGEGDARRLSMDADVLMRQSGADKDLLRALEDTFLLRREVNTTGGWNYELSHDTLLKPVLDWREERRGEEEQVQQRIEAEKARERAEALEREAAEERLRAEEALRLQRAAEEEKRKAQKMSWIAIGMAFLAFLGLLGAGWLYNRSEKDKEKAEQERNKAFQSDRLAQIAKKEAIEKAWAAQRSDSLAQVDKKNAEQAKSAAQSAELKTQEAFMKLNNEINAKTHLFMNEIKNWEQANNYILKEYEWKEKIDILNFESYFLTTLPHQVYECKNLKELTLNDNSKMQWSDVLPKLKNIKSLKILNLMYGQITFFPKEFGEMKNLISLNLSENAISALPPDIGGMSNLTTLDLSNNKLTALPPEIGKLKNLKKLILNSNRVVKLPYEIKELSDLTTLFLGDNNLSVLPVEIEYLKHLKSLYLYDNDFEIFPMEVIKLNNLTLLDLRNNKLTSLPTEIGEFKKLTSLNLIGNKLILLPMEIAKLKELNSLSLGNNKFTMIPTEVFELTNLTRLELPYNQLSILSPKIRDLINLTHLNLSNNQLTNLPVAISELKNLTHLNLRNNQLANLPIEISELKNLKYLELHGNFISKSEQERIRQLLPPKCFISF